MRKYAGQEELAQGHALEVAVVALSAHTHCMRERCPTLAWAVPIHISCPLTSLCHRL